MPSMYSRFAVAVVALAIPTLIAAACGGDTSDTKEKRTMLSIDDTATAKGANGRQDVQVAIAVKEGKPEDLANFRLDADEKKMTPWYITETLVNKGKDVKPDDPVPVLLKPEDDKGLEAKKIGLIGDFPQCELVNVPDPFPAGATNTSCQVYLVPEGSTLAKVVFEETRFEGANRVYEWKVS